MNNIEGAKAYIKIEATNPPEENAWYHTNIGQCVYFPHNKTWITLNDTDDIAFPEYYLQEINLSDLMIEFAELLYKTKLSSPKPTDHDKLLTEFLTQKGIVIKY